METFRVCQARCGAGLLAVLSTLHSVTAEPVQFLYMIAAFMQFSIFQDLVYHEACAVSYTPEICANLSAHPEPLAVVQARASYWVLASTVAMMVPAVPAAALLGAWGDARGRRLPMALPPLGAALGALVLAAIGLGLRPALPFIIIASALAGLCGGFASCVASAASYVAAVSGVGSRTSRVAILEAMTFAGGAVGPLLAGSLLPVTSHAAVFTVIATIHFVTIAYITLVLQPVPRILDTSPEEEVDGIVTQRSSFNCCKQLIEVWRTCSCSRPAGKRAALLASLFACFIIMIVSAGEMETAFLVVREPPLDWSYTRFAHFVSLRALVSAVVLFTAAPLLLCASRHLQATWASAGVRDWLVSMGGLVCRAVALVMLGLAVTDLQVWLVAFVAAGSVLSTPALRSLLSQLVEPHEIGKVLAALGSLESICTLLGSLIFNSLYPVFLKHNRPGLTFIVAAAALALPALLICYGLLVSVRAQRMSPQLQLLDEDEEEEE